jgi:hypothetical protein
MSGFQTICEIDLEDYGRALVQAGRYRHGGHIAITLIDAASFEPIAVLSTNLAPGGVKLDRDSFAVKVWSENEALIVPMLASGLFGDTGARIATGFVQAPVWRIKNPAHIPPMERRPERERR